MKKFFFILILIGLYSHTLVAQNIFDANHQSINHNTNFSIVIGLNNDTQVTAFQFDINYNPNAFDLLNGHNLITSRAPNHIISANVVSAGIIRVIVFSSSNQMIQIGSGPILNLFCKSKNFPGTYNLTITNIVLSNQNGNQVTVAANNGSVTVTGPKFELNTSNINFGEIPIGSSPTSSVSITNGGNTDLIISSYNLDAPFSIETNFPLTVSAGSSSNIPIGVNTAVKQVVAKELSFTTNDSDPLRALQKTTLQADIFAVNEIYIGSGSGDSNTPITIPVTFSNMEPFSGFQFDIILPNNVSFVPNSSVFTSRADDHVIAANMVSNNILRFVAFSSTNSNFSGNNGEVFSFQLIPNLSSGTYGLNITNPIMSNATIGDITSAVYNGSISINAPELTTNVETINYGRVPITETRTTSVNLTNTGAATLIVDQLLFDSSTLAFPLSLPLSISVGNSVSTDLVFSPSSLGIYNKNISIRNNSPQLQKIINVIADVFSPNYLKILDQTVYRNESSIITVNLSNNDPVRGIQFDLQLLDGFVLDSQSITPTPILNNFSLSVSSLGANEYRFVIFTFSSNNIPSGNQSILNLPVFINASVPLGNYPLDFTNVVLSSQTNQNIASEALEIGMINVENPLNIDKFDKISIIIYPNPTSLNWIINSSQIIENIKIFDLNGTLILKYNVNDTSFNLDATNIASGMYLLIINDKKSLKIMKY